MMMGSHISQGTHGSKTHPRGQGAGGQGLLCPPDDFSSIFLCSALTGPHCPQYQECWLTPQCLLAD